MRSRVFSKLDILSDIFVYMPDMTRHVIVACGVHRGVIPERDLISLCGNHSPPV